MFSSEETSRMVLSGSEIMSTTCLSDFDTMRERECFRQTNIIAITISRLAQLRMRTRDESRVDKTS